MIAEARGRAATIVEEGKATAASLREVARTWTAAGEDAHRLIVAQKLGTLVDQMMSTVQKTGIDKVTVMSPTLTDGSPSLAARAVVANEQLKHTLGIDPAAALRKLTAG
jgi:flotillin